MSTLFEPSPQISSLHSRMTLLNANSGNFSPNLRECREGRHICMTSKPPSYVTRFLVCCVTALIGTWTSDDTLTVFIIETWKLAHFCQPIPLHLEALKGLITCAKAMIKSLLFPEMKVLGFGRRVPNLKFLRQNCRFIIKYSGAYDWVFTQLDSMLFSWFHLKDWQTTEDKSRTEAETFLKWLH